MSRRPFSDMFTDIIKEKKANNATSDTESQSKAFKDIFNEAMNTNKCYTALKVNENLQTD